MIVKSGSNDNNTFKAACAGTLLASMYRMRNHQRHENHVVMTES